MHRRLTLCLIAVALMAACSSGTKHRPIIRRLPTTTVPDTATTSTSTSTTVAPPAPTVAPRAPATRPRPVAPAHPSAPAPARSGNACPPDPHIPGVEYRCYPGAAEGHRGLSCQNYPGSCPGQRFIAVDPSRTSDPNCVLANEVYNTTHGYGQDPRYPIDPNGSCP